MLISVITICYNRSKTIDASIQSVLNQDYPNIEYIIIDGNSNDGTKEIIAAYGDRISKYVSEKDKGMYDAINKGVKLATGDVIGLMHSDDTFYDNEVVSKIVKAFEEHDSIDGVYGDGIYVTNDAEERLVRNRIGGEYNLKRIKQGWLPLHPTVYFRKSCFEKYGLYNLDFKIASDTEFLIRYLYKHEVKMHYLNSYMVKMKMGGLSTDYKRAVEVLKEDYKIYKFHNMNPFSAVFQKKMHALQQYLKK
jgi:glycosyltransferase